MEHAQLFLLLGIVGAVFVLALIIAMTEKG